MMKRLFSALLILTLLFSALPVALNASTITRYITDTIYYTLDEEAGTLTFSGTGPMPECVFNEKNEWSRNASATTIIIEDGITGIGSYNFYKNSYVTRVIVGDSVKKIGISAFSSCTNLVSFDCGGELDTINNFAFSTCISLQGFYFPPTLKSIGMQAFYGCTKLTSIELPEGIQTIYADAFNDSGYYKSLTSGLHSLCGYTLEYKGSPSTTVRIPEGTKVISIRTLSSPKNVTALIFPESLEKILTLGLYDFPSVKEVTIPGSVTVIENFGIGYVPDNAYAAPVAKDGFLIKGRASAAARRYAEECGFAYECLCTEEDAEYIYYPDCLAGGTAELGCRYCGKVYATEEVPPAEAHQYGDVLTEEPTCTQDGRTYRKCALCGDELTEDVVRASGHVPGTTPVITPATCTEMGTLTFFCTVCGEECADRTMYLPAAGHAVPDEFTVVSEPTCTEPGIRQKKCSVCGEIVETEETPATGHNVSSRWTVLVQSTVSETTVSKGFRVKLCTKCNVAAQYEYYYVGDMNSDGNINVKDIPLIKKMLAGNDSEVVADNADFNGDGVINVSDLKDLKRFMTG